MNILVVVEHLNGNYKKSSFEAVSFAKAYANASGASLTGITFNSAGHDELGHYGLEKLVQLNDDKLTFSDSKAAAKAIAEYAKANNITSVILSNSANGKGIAGRLSIRLEAGLVSGAIDIPSDKGVKKGVFSGKAFEYVKVNTEVSVISVTPNAYGVKENQTSVSIEEASANLSDSDYSVKVVNQDIKTGKTPLPEAELVVSGGRGLKGPENWGIIEDLAEILGATTACSRPVADSHWRPHEEHVGQTGGTIRPNLYIAVGISGAIQHLAGVNQSKVIVVINKDPEAPFFKAADYGIVGDAFEVMPKIIEAAKAFKAS